MRTPVVFGADSRFAMPLAVSIASLVRSADDSDGVEIHILAPETHTATQTLVETAVNDRCPLQWHIVGADQFEGLPTVDGISAATYYRLLIPRLIDAERALYLDSDILVRSSLVDAMTLELEGRAAAAARNLTIPFVASPLGVVGWRDMQLEPNAPYFNAGVLLMDLPRWRRLEVSERALDYLGRHQDEVRLADQEALNAALYGQWSELDPVWNQQPFIQDDWSGAHAIVGDEAVRAAREDPRIVHFVGPVKPWHVGCTRPWTQEWRAVAVSLDERWRPNPRRSRREEAAWRIRRAAHAIVRGR